MKGKERFSSAIAGRKTDVTAVMLKMWVDVAAHVMNLDLVDVLGNPAIVTSMVVNTARRLGMDGARVLLFPRRSFMTDSCGNLVHVDDKGHAIGVVDRNGGWKTCLTDCDYFDLENPDHIAHYHCYQSPGQLIAGMDDIKRLTVPTAAYYETAGCGDFVAASLLAAGDDVACAGDCNSGTLPLLAALRGMSDAMMDLVDNPGLVHAILEKGVQMSLERARFFVARGIRILRYNDSIANMSVISPDCFRHYVLPRIRDFCTGAHGLAPDVKVYCHICGNVQPILPDLACSGLDCIAPLDPLGGFNLTQARQAVGESVVLMGGINTLSFIRSTPDEIAKEALDCIHAGNANGSYILGSGCALPPDSRLDNLLSVIRTAHAAFA